MRVLYCWNDDFPEAVAAIEKHIPQAEIIDTSANSYAYWDAMEIRWTGVQDLLIVEHDVVVTAEVLPQMLACPEPWCAHSSGGTPFGLRCTRFSARLQQLLPATAIRAKARRKCPHCGALHWAFIDGPICTALAAIGFSQPHVHEPELKHCNWQNP